jgi:NitT/TauT family transport system permease protein
VIPAVLPRLWSSLRLSLGISFSVIFFAESFATRYGVGFFIVNAWAQVNYADVYAGILALSLVGFLMFRLVDAAERLTCPWLRSE